MNTYLFTWNPKVFHWNELEDAINALTKQGYWDDNHTCSTTQVRPGDRFFLLRQGVQPRGIMASGHVTSERYKAPHFNEPGKIAPYVRVRFDKLLNPSIEKILETTQLIDAGLTDVHWNTQSSGIRIPPESAATLEALWASFLAGHGSPITAPEEIRNPELFFEGSLRQVNVDAYERNSRAREACIRRHGLACKVCGLKFEDRYGELGKGFIHVHHIVPLALIGQEYALDPVNHLVPVCPNCHAMLHRGEEALSIEELRRRLR